MTMKNEVIKVQEPTSRPDSVRQRLGNAAWRAGTSTFVANGVPFSFTSGPVLAGCVCDLVAFLAEEDTERSPTIHDVGAGTGYLTRHIIEMLAKRDPNLARECCYIASDSSPEMVETMSTVLSSVSPDLQDRVTVRTGEALSPDDILDGAPSVVLMSYLVDAVAPIHVVRSGDEAHEILVETFIVADQPVLDGSTWPPRVLEGEELAEVLRSSPESLSPGAILQTLPLIVEGAVEGPSLPDEIASASPSPLFNARPGVALMISELVERLDPESIVLVTDFGYSGAEVTNELGALMTEYGSAACYAVFFEELIAAAENSGAICCVQSVTAAGTHTLVIYKGDRKAAFRSLFENVFGKMDQDHEGIKLFNDGEAVSLEEVLAAEQCLRASMSSGEVPAYADLANVAHLLGIYVKHEEARFHASACDLHYGLIAAPEQLLLGDLAAIQNDIDKALEWYERARETAPTYGPAHVKAAEVYLSTTRYSNYAVVMKAYAQVTDEPMWAHIEWLTGLNDQIPEDVPDDVRDEFALICRAEFGREGDDVEES